MARSPRRDPLTSVGAGGRLCWVTRGSVDRESERRDWGPSDSRFRASRVVRPKTETRGLGSRDSLARTVVVADGPSPSPSGAPPRGLSRNSIGPSTELRQTFRRLQ